VTTAQRERLPLHVVEAGDEPTAEWDVLGLGSRHIAQVVEATQADARKSAILVALAR
jgi:hypothetical protein